MRGAVGGYRLARPAREITVWSALQVLGGEFFPESFCACHRENSLTGIGGWSDSIRKKSIAPPPHQRADGKSNHGYLAAADVLIETNEQGVVVGAGTLRTARKLFDGRVFPQT